MEHPWQQSVLSSWSIVGMNHYFVNGDKRLFVGMVKGDRFIKEEGIDSQYLWNRLCHKAMEIDNQPFKSDAHICTDCGKLLSESGHSGCCNRTA